MSLLDSEFPGDWDARRKTVYRYDDCACCNCQRRGGASNSLSRCLVDLSGEPTKFGHFSDGGKTKYQRIIVNSCHGIQTSIP